MISLDPLWVYCTEAPVEQLSKHSERPMDFMGVAFFSRWEANDCSISWIPSPVTAEVLNWSVKAFCGIDAITSSSLIVASKSILFLTKMKQAPCAWILAKFTSSMAWLKESLSVALYTNKTAWLRKKWERVNLAYVSSPWVSPRQNYKTK